MARPDKSRAQYLTLCNQTVTGAAEIIPPGKRIIQADL